MKTKFLNIDQKRKIYSLEPNETINCLFNEVDRLEHIIRHYETHLKMISDAYSENLFKTPNEI